MNFVVDDMSVEYDDITDDDLMNMDDEEIDKYVLYEMYVNRQCHIIEKEFIRLRTNEINNTKYKRKMRKDVKMYGVNKYD